MSGSPPPVPILKFFDNNGNPLAFGLVYTYQAGTLIQTPTYTDSTLGTANANPFTLNFRGEMAMWIPVNTAIKINVTDSAGNQIPGWPQDQIQNTQLSITATSIGLLLYPQTTAEVTAGVTPTFYYYPPLDTRRYGSDPTGVADSTAAINNAILVARVNGGAVRLTAGTYKTTNVLNIGDFSNVYLQGDGAGATTLMPTQASGNVVQFGASSGASNCGIFGIYINCTNAASVTALYVFSINNFYCNQVQSYQ